MTPEAARAILRGMRFAVALLLAAGPVRAQPADEDPARAKRLYGAGAIHYEEGDYRRALEEFEAAYRYAPHPALLYNIAQCYDRLGNVDAAIAYGERYLKEAPEAPDRSAVAAWLRSLRARRGNTPERPEAPAPGNQPQTPPPPPSAAAADAGDEPAGDAPTRKDRLAGDGTDAAVTAQETSLRPPSWAPWVSLGVGLAAAGLGTAFGLRTLGRGIDRDDGASSAGTGATVSFSIAATAAVAAGALWAWRAWTGDSPAPTSHVRVEHVP